MPRTAVQNAIIRDKRKTKIMMRTLKLFATRGFDEITIDGISNESNCSHGLVYHYFEKKDDIFNDLLDLQNEEFKESVFPKDEALAAGGLEGLKLVCDYYENLKNLSKNHLYFAKVALNRDFTTYSATKELNGESPLSTIATLCSQAGLSEDVAVAFVDYLNGVVSRLISAEGKMAELPSGQLFAFITK
ncbi:MAG: TetR/AcrR family transcriptional regulator [Bacilli bacterium]|nr:TetR/AcrR family transcriptional regulator [Bacilli bacterium]